MKKLIKTTLLGLIVLFSFVFPQSIQATTSGVIESINVDSRFMSVVEIDDGEVISHYQKNGDARMYPASMTKIMTAFVASQHLTDMSQSVTILESDLAGLKEASASMAGLRVGEVVTVGDLLYGSLLESGADATRTLARLISGDEASFVQLMNQTATELGMSSTNFVNTSGLHDENHYSTTNDLIKLMVASLKLVPLKEMMSTLTYQTEPTNLHPYGLTFHNTLLSYSQIGKQDIGRIRGGKTGWTPQAGYCLLSFTDFNEKTIIIASGDAFDYGIQLKDHNLIYTELLEKTHPVEIFTTNQQIGEVPINYASKIKKFPLVMTESVILDLPKVVNKDDLTISVNHAESMDSPIAKEIIMGDVSVEYGGQKLYSTQFTNPEQISRNEIYYYSSQFVNWLIQPVVYLTIIGIISLVPLTWLGSILVRKYQHRRRRYRFGSRRSRFNRSKNQWRL